MAGRERARGDKRESPEGLSALLDHLRSPVPEGGARQIDRFAVRTLDRFVLMPAANVRWIEAAGHYAELHATGASHLVRATLVEIEAGLDPARVARFIHRTWSTGTGQAVDAKHASPPVNPEWFRPGRPVPG